MDKLKNNDGIQDKNDTLIIKIPTSKTGKAREFTNMCKNIYPIEI